MSDEISPRPSWYDPPDDPHHKRCPLSNEYKPGPDEKNIMPMCRCPDLEAEAIMNHAEFEYDIRRGN